MHSNAVAMTNENLTHPRIDRLNQPPMKIRASETRAVLLAFGIVSIGIARGATIAWTNISGGNWSAPVNWDPNQTPGVADAVVITNDGTYTVAFDVSANIASLTLGGSSGTQTLAKSSSTLTLNN